MNRSPYGWNSKGVDTCSAEYPAMHRTQLLASQTSRSTARVYHLIPCQFIPTQANESSHQPRNLISLFSKQAPNSIACDDQGCCVALALHAQKVSLGKIFGQKPQPGGWVRIGGRPSTSMVGCKDDALRVWAELRVRRQAARRVEELAQAAAVRADLARRVTPSSGIRHVEQITAGGTVQVRGHAARRLPPSRQRVWKQKQLQTCQCAERPAAEYKIMRRPLPSRRM